MIKEKQEASEDMRYRNNLDRGQSRSRRLYRPVSLHRVRHDLKGGIADLLVLWVGVKLEDKRVC